MNRALAEAGPWFSKLGPVDWAQWEHAARWLETQLPEGPHREQRIHWLTLPLARWLAQRVEGATQRPLFAGLSAPQGAGKTSLVKVLVPLLAQWGLRAIAVSIDDFYLRREEQLQLAAAHPGNVFLEHRGYPGTHDLALGVATLEALKRGGEVMLPRYDKAAFGGRGDRSAQGEVVHGPFDVVLLEGWMLGFEPVVSPPPELETVNELLRGYAAWTQRLDVMIALRAAEPQFVLRWRVEAEQVLSRAEVEDYVRRFLPAYACWGNSVRADLEVVLDVTRGLRGP